MYRVVLDTNIYLSAFIYGGNPEKLFELARQNKIHLLVSPSILAEFSLLLKAKFYWEENDIIDALRTIGYSSELIKPEFKLTVVKEDAADNKIIECARKGNAAAIPPMNIVTWPTSKSMYAGPPPL